MKAASQPSLFDLDPVKDDGEAERARTKMRAMIDRLRATTEPWWKTAMDAHLETGAFRRAMWLLPKEEAEALWAEYQVDADRLYAAWDAAHGFPPLED